MKTFLCTLYCLLFAPIAILAQARIEAKCYRPFLQHSQPALYSGLKNSLVAMPPRSDGDFRLDFFIGSEHANYVVNEPIIVVVPKLGHDENKLGILRISVRDKDHSAFIPVREDTFKIQFPPLYVKAEDDPSVGEKLTLSAWLGPIPDGIELPQGIELRPVDGFFPGGPAKESGPMRFQYDFYPAVPQSDLPPSGRDLEIAATDPVTQQSRLFTIHISPKAEKQ
jgi:hypothetical protein